jgi:hypothetical protein
MLEISVLCIDILELVIVLTFWVQMIIFVMVKNTEWSL